ncbi:hypothetical protein E4U52_006207 [Claviceps spartinae]|nr:hypothetical protein E4U52_006207 [Claviceps spartinae]
MPWREASSDLVTSVLLSLRREAEMETPRLGTVTRPRQDAKIRLPLESGTNTYTSSHNNWTLDSGVLILWTSYIQG